MTQEATQHIAGMKKLKVFFVFAFLCLVVLSSKAFADILILKSGEEIKGKILERTDVHVKLETPNSLRTFNWDQIEKIRTRDSPLFTTRGWEILLKKKKEKPSFNTVKIAYNVIYKIVGDFNSERKGVKTVYIDVIENKRRDELTEDRIIKTGQRYIHKTERNVKIFDGQKLYSIDLSKEEATYFEGFNQDNFFVWVEADFDETAFVRKEKFLGKECSVFLIDDTYVWVWESLILRKEREKENSFLLMRATKIEENIEFDDDKFRVPDNISVESETEELESSMQSLMTAMKDFQKQKNDADVPQSSTVEEESLDTNELEENDIDAAIKRLLDQRLSANDALARSNLKSISLAIESFRANNNGYFPVIKEELLLGEKPYLLEFPHGRKIEGHYFSITLHCDGYELIATPTECGESGSKNIIVTPGGKINEEECILSAEE